MNNYTREDFDYINFDYRIQRLNHMQTFRLIMYVDENKNLYCYHTNLLRSIHFDRKKYQWVIDKGKKKIADFKEMASLNHDLAEDIYYSIPPFDTIRELEEEEENSIKQRYEELRKKTKHRVIGWVSSTKGYKPVRDVREHYTAALLNDIIEHQYCFVAMWCPLVPVFENGRYLALSDRQMGFLLALSKGDASQDAYIPYAFDDDIFINETDGYNTPKEGLYEDK